MPQYDLVIPCAPKDYSKLKLCVTLALQFIHPKPEHVYVVSRDKINLPGVIYVDENNCIDIKKDQITYRRPGWIFQQLIKLTQNFTVNNYYFCLDADTFFNAPLEVLKDDTLTLFLTNKQQHHKPYFNFMKKIFDLDKQIENTFICDFMMMRKDILMHHLPANFLQILNDNLSEDMLLSEYELFGNLMAKYYPKFITYKNIKTRMHGDFRAFSSEEVLDIVHTMGNFDIDTISIHSWT